jgi:hypothetical protein
MGFEPMIEVLQTSALPLGYVAEPPRFYPNRGRLSKNRHFRRVVHVWPASSLTSTRRNTLPTIVLGSESRNSICFGTLYPTSRSRQ